MKKTAVENIRDLMQQIITEHEAELEACNRNVQNTRSRIAEAEQAMKEATAVTDFEAYSKARQDRQEAEIELEMYMAKLKQTENAGYISEAESDEAVEQLFRYEDDLASGYLEDAAPHVTALMDLAKTYNESLQASRDVLNTWTHKIHAYYKNSMVQSNGRNVPGKVFRAMPEAEALNAVTKEYTNNAALMKVIRDTQEGSTDR